MKERTYSTMAGKGKGQRGAYGMRPAQRGWMGMAVTAALLAGAISGCGSSEVSNANSGHKSGADGTASYETDVATTTNEALSGAVADGGAGSVEALSGAVADGGAGIAQAREAAEAEVSGGAAAGVQSQDASMSSSAAVYAMTDGLANNGWEEMGLYEDAEVYGGTGWNTEEYDALTESGFSSVAVSPLSTFSADVDTASYANLRRMIQWGYTASEIPNGAVRTEEMLNYFTYTYNGPKNGEPFGVNAQIAPCPWDAQHLLLHLGLQTEAIDYADAPDSNIVFLIDVSGSMYDENKLPLVQQAFNLLVDQLDEKDTVSLVTYASGTDIVLDGVPGDQTALIQSAINSLVASGATNGGDGIDKAYALAEDHFIRRGNNRVIVASDGDWNVGNTSQSELYDMITEKKESGIYLSVLGFGMGNYSDSRMQTLADAGNGNYAYIDSVAEARKVLVEELGATLVTVAEDVKLQVEFNPAYVSEYRLLGYENRRLATEDFADDDKDAGEVGAGHSVTVLYELVPAGVSGSTSDLRYQEVTLSETAKSSDEWLCLSVRYKEPGRSVSQLLEYPIGYDRYTETPGNDFRFAGAVAEFSLLLRDSQYKGDADYGHVLDTLEGCKLSDEYRQEFYDLVTAIAFSEAEYGSSEW